MKKVIDRKFIKKIASAFEDFDPVLLKEALNDDIRSAPDTFFLNRETRTYPIGTAPHAYVSYMGAICCGDKESANKIAGILRDIYDIEPPTPKQKTANTKGHVKVADGYIDLLPREEKYKEKLASMKHGYVSGEIAKNMMHLRNTFYAMNKAGEAKEDIVKAYNKIANIVCEYDVAHKKMTQKELAKLASAVEFIDNKVGLDKYYGKHILDPIDLVNSFIVNKEASIKIGSRTITDSAVKNISKNDLAGLLDKDELDYIFVNNKLDLDRLANYIENVNPAAAEKIRKVLNMFI